LPVDYSFLDLSGSVVNEKYTSGFAKRYLNL
jgi:hypothetical protein